jgi:hypothetical protein
MSPKRRKLAEQAIYQQVSQRLRELAADPTYRALPIEGNTRMIVRQRLLNSIRKQYPDATLRFLQGIFQRVAQDLSANAKTGDNHVRIDSRTQLS